MSRQKPGLAVLISLLFLTQGVVFAQSFPNEDSGPGFSGYTPAVTTALPAQTAWPGVVTAPQKVILLRNGQVINGEILSEGETVSIRSELGIVPVSRADIAMIAATLREVYQFQKANVSKTAVGYAQLADWCAANKLPDEAAAEFDRAILLADNPQLADVIRNRKNAVLSMFEERQLQTRMTDLENRKYLLWKQKIPPATFATFKREILPMLVQNCSGIACHSGNSLSQFRFVPNPHNTDADVAKNLQVLLGYITPGSAEESPLVLIPIAPHGRTKEVFTRRNLAQLEKLYAWTEQVASEMNAYYPLDATDRVAVLPDGQRPQTLSADRQAVALRESNSNTPAQNPPSSGSGVSPTDPPRVANNYSPAQATDFHFFTGQSGASSGTVAGNPQPPPAGVQQERKSMMTRDGLSAFEQESRLQQLQRAPVDPFDPVLFNRQYHLPLLKEKTRQ